MAPCVGCDRAPSTPPDEPPSLQHRVIGNSNDAGLAELLGIDVEMLEPPPLDPVGPPGDLLTEINDFTSLDACVKARTVQDPLLADAVDALGYDSLQRDACRVLQAAKNKDISACNPILSSSLKQHCQTTVAAITGSIKHCPFVSEHHNPLCIALAQRDSRLCVSAPTRERKLCRAMLAKDVKKCDGDERCARIVSRWKSVLPDKVDGLALGTRATLTITPIGEHAKLAKRDYELSDVISGASVVRSPTGTAVTLGESSTTGWPTITEPTKPRIRIHINASDELIRQGTRDIDGTRVAVDVLVAGARRLSTEGADDRGSLHVDMFRTGIGDPVRFTLEFTLGPSHDRQRVKFVVNTYVKDVVVIGDEQKLP